MIHLKGLHFTSHNQTTFPFNMPVFKRLENVTFNSPITYFVGENGTGKSTLLEAIAYGAGSITIGSESVSSDETLEHIKLFTESLRFSWTLKTNKGFFMRAEDVFGFTKWLEQEKKEFEAEAQDLDDMTSDYGRMRKSTLLRGQKGAFESRYGHNLDANSHGETFLKLFQTRFQKGGLYLLDEPEAPLSFKRQLSLVYMLRQMIKQDAQFIIATHSPILTAMPEADMYSFDTGEIKKVLYSELEQFNLMRDFLNNPNLFLKQLED